MSLRNVQRALNRGDAAKAGELLHAMKRADSTAALWGARIANAAAGPSQARAELESALSAHPTAIPLRLESGLMYLDAGDVAQARAEFAEVLTAQPENTLAQSYLALCYWMLDDAESARARVAKYGLSRNTEFMVRLACWMESEWLASGRFFFQRPMESAGSPTRAFLRSSRGSAVKAFYAKDYRNVFALMSPRLERRPNDTEAAYACAFACEMLHDHERALAILAPLGDDEGLPDFLAAARARNLVRLGDYRRALGLLAPVLVPGPEDYGVHYYLAVLSLACSQNDQAQTLMRRAFTSFVVDTLDYQYWQIERALELPLR